MNALAYEESAGKDYYLGGEMVMNFSQFVELLTREMIAPSNRYNFSFNVAHGMGKVLERLPRSVRFMTSDEIIRMKYDAIVPTAPGTLTLQDLFITPVLFRPTIARCMSRHRGGRDAEREDAPPPLDVI